MPREVTGWLAAALLFASFTAWRDASELQALDVLAAFGALGMAGIALRDDRMALFAPRLRDTLVTAAAIAGNVARGIVPLALRELFTTERAPSATRRARAMLRASLIVAAVVIVFGSLLRSADPIFARFVALPDLDFGTIASHTIVAGFFAWVAGGWIYGGLVADPSGPRAPDSLPFALRSLDVTVALGTLTALFSAFVLAQLGWLFGGETFLRQTTGLTAAEYARQGFFQMVAVVALVVPLLLGTRALLAPGAALRRRHTMLSLPVVGLLGAIILSAVLRMRMYTHFYGLTIDRLDTLVFMGWLALVLGLLTVTVLRDTGRLFVAGSVVSALGVLAALHVVVPDRIVALANVGRSANVSVPTAARNESALDLRHLTSLSAEAVDVAIAATLAPPTAITGTESRRMEDAQRCDAASRLLNHWGPSSRARDRVAALDGWKSWNWGERRALRIVGARSAQLRSVVHSTCPATYAARRQGRAD